MRETGTDFSERKIEGRDLRINSFEASSNNKHIRPACLCTEMNLRITRGLGLIWFRIRAVL